MLRQVAEDGFDRALGRARPPVIGDRAHLADFAVRLCSTIRAASV
jgi:hypothetical protein